MIIDTNDKITLEKVKVTTQKIHKAIQKTTDNLSAKYKPSEKIDRRGYNVSTFFKGVFIVSPDYSRNQTTQDIVNILANEGIKSEIVKDVVKVKRTQ